MAPENGKCAASKSATHRVSEALKGQSALVRMDRTLETVIAGEFRALAARGVRRRAGEGRCSSAHRSATVVGRVFDGDGLLVAVVLGAGDVGDR